MSRLSARLFFVVALPVVAALGAFALGTHAARARGVAPTAATSARLPLNASPARVASAVARNPRLKGAYRFTDNGWIYVHLQGSPANIGYQHGYLLAPEIADAFKAIKLETVHNTHHSWAFFRSAAKNMLWPHIPLEYQTELKGIVAGINARGVKLDLWDIVAFNAFSELPGYYVPWYDARHQKRDPEPPTAAYDHCSAFVATGDWTKNHQIVMAHNNWTSYLEGERWKIIFDIQPEHGYRILMDGFPGAIASDDDFGINSAGIMITETTISDFHGWNPNGIPEFVRAREAMQYANSIASYVKIMNEGNNGGYANDWLLGDEKTGEIARFEEGLKYTKLWTTKNGYFVGSNFPSDPDVTKYETTFNPNDLSNSANARHLRWKQLMKEYKGKIDTQLAEKFEGDHYDTFEKKIDPDERTLCGHLDLSPRGAHPFAPFGAVQSKVTDSRMVEHMELIAHLGHPCGESFYAKPFLKAHPQWDWEAPVLGNMLAYPWTQFHSGEEAAAK